MSASAESSLLFMFPVDLLLKVQSIDLMKSKSGENRTKHHANLYQSDDFIIRRGQMFQVWITLSRPLDPNADKLHLEVKTGEFAARLEQLCLKKSIW